MQYLQTLTFDEFKKIGIRSDALIKVTINQQDNIKNISEIIAKLKGSGNGNLTQAMRSERLKERSRG
jgi:hypothetical protein